MRRVLTAGMALAMVVFLAACDTTPPQGARVFVYGDSITKEAFGSGGLTFWGSKYAITDRTAFMAIPCQFNNQVAYDASTVPDVVVFNFAGNGGSFIEHCMDGTPSNLVWARYYNDIGAQIDRFRNGHTRIVIVGGVYRPRTDYAGGNVSNDVFTALQALARNKGVTFVDGGKDITPYRVAYSSAPCLGGIEYGDRCGTAGPGRNVIRDAELEHLCPYPANVFLGTCNIYSSGSVRLALAILTGINTSVVAP
jgi:hypothetical protein